MFPPPLLRTSSTRPRTFLFLSRPPSAAFRRVLDGLARGLHPLLVLRVGDRARADGLDRHALLGAAVLLREDERDLLAGGAGQELVEVDRRVERLARDRLHDVARRDAD